MLPDNTAGNLSFMEGLISSAVLVVTVIIASGSPPKHSGQAGPRYGVDRNYETCTGHCHWHFSVGW